MTTSTTARPTPTRRSPTVRRFNRVVSTLLRLGVPMQTMQLLTVPGRRTGEPRTTPIATLTHEGAEYVMQAFPGAAWVDNVRAAGRGVIRRGRRTRTVTFTEVPVEERGPILRHAGEIAPEIMRRRFVENGIIDEPTAEALEASAPTTTVFRIDPV
jgi:deazaflavin-dependent oxidoreductase (nitroreductase family)